MIVAAGSTISRNTVLSGPLCSPSRAGKLRAWSASVGAAEALKACVWAKAGAMNVLAAKPPRSFRRSTDERGGAMAFGS